MNYRLLSKNLGIVSLLIGGAMTFSLPWAWPGLGYRAHLLDEVDVAFEVRAFSALLISIFICVLVGGLLMWAGRKETGTL
jgi:trk system potassium uptake protein